MNLLIEQRPTTLTSPKPQTSSSSSQQQQSQISNENDMNNSSSSSSLVLKIKRHSTKQQQNNDLHSNSSHMSEEDNQNNNSPASRLKRTSISNTISTRRPSSPAFNGKQQQQQNSAKRSITTDNNNNDLTSNLDEISSTKRFKREDLNSSSLRKVDACVETVSVGLATEPDQLGPCEPGTSVVLEGIVWNETDSGVLVVNVTWRGKTYVGTLLDSTKQDWACPRLTCESPTSDYDARGGSKTSRSKRTGAGGNTRSSTQQNISLCQQVISNNHLAGIDERRLRNNIKSRQSKRLNNLPSTTNDETPINSPPPRTTPTTNQTFFPSETSTSEPHLISCSEHQCHKRFTSTTALTYHLSNAHKQTESSPISTSTTVPQPSTTRDEEDVAHILANVADYVRRSSPPSSIRCSPEHQHSPPITTTTTTIKPLENSSTLTWPCPQISSNLVLPSSLNQVLSPDSTNRCKLNNNECNSIEQNDLKNSAKPADHFLLHIKDEPIANKSTTISSPNYQDLNNSKKTSPVPPPPSTLSASSPAYSDISDEEPTTTTTEPVLPPSTVNLLTATNGKIDENGNNLHSSSSSSSIPTSSDLTNPAWTAQMLLQQFGPFIQQQQTLVTDISSTPNRLNSNNTCPSSNGTSDSTVKNILDTRRSSTTKSSSSPPTNLYPFHSNESKFPTPIINTLTSPNENLLHLSTSTIKPMDVIDYSLNNTRSSNAGQYHHSSSLHPSR